MSRQKKVPSTKVSVNVVNDMLAAWRAMAARRGCSLTEMLRVMLSREKMFDDEVAAGSQVLIEQRGTKRLRQIVWDTIPTTRGEGGER